MAHPNAEDVAHPNALEDGGLLNAQVLRDLALDPSRVPPLIQPGPTDEERFWSTFEALTKRCYLRAEEAARVAFRLVCGKEK